MRHWVARLVLPGLAVLMLFAITQLYNAWIGIAFMDHIRVRSVATAALGILVFGPAILRRARMQAIYLGVASLMLGLLIMANSIYSAYAGGFLSASTLSYLRQTGDTGSNILQLFQAKMLLLLVPAGVFFAIAWMTRRPNTWWSWRRLGRWSTLGTVVAVIVMASLGYGYCAYLEYKQWGDLSRIVSRPFDSRELEAKLGIINYNILDGIKYAQRKRSISPAEVAFIEKNRSSQVTVSGPNVATGWLAGRNVIFLQLESFQQFVIGRQVNGQEITPNLNKLAAESRQFTNFNYTVGPGTSSDAEFATFNSLLPLYSQSVAFDYPSNAYQSYPSALRKQDYSTHAYHADGKTFWNRSTTYPVFGFDEFVDEAEYGNERVLGFGLNDRDFLKQTVEKIAKLDSPFYAHAITVTSHSPFKLPADLQTLDLSGVSLTPLQKDYLQSVHYTDKAIGDFIEALDKAGLKDNMAMIVMGDHEGFISDRGDLQFAKFLGYEHGYDETTTLTAHTIPFLIYAPGSPISGIDARPASQIDIYPTLMNLLGMRKPSTILGVDLYGEQEPTVVRRSRGVGANIESVQRSDLQYASNAYGDGRPGCFRGAQPVETRTCDALRDFAVTRALMSDYVIKGNRIDLLSPTTQP